MPLIQQQQSDKVVRAMSGWLSFYKIRDEPIDQISQISNPSKTFIDIYLAADTGSMGIYRIYKAPPIMLIPRLLKI